jgi:hypothetical protein
MRTLGTQMEDLTSYKYNRLIQQPDELLVQLRQRNETTNRDKNDARKQLGCLYSYGKINVTLMKKEIISINSHLNTFKITVFNITVISTSTN